MTGSLAPGTRLGARYRIVRLLAEGGMGAVYEAQHLELGRRVAIKTLLSELQDQPRLIQRFIREARATCMIAHSNVVSVLDIDQTPDGIIFFVMEYLEGSDVSEVLERDGPIGWRRAQGIALQVCAALAAAHERGVVHRDLKPSNCFLARDEAGLESLKVLDFGIAKVLESNGPHAARRGPGQGTGRDLRWLKTSTGEVFGTLAYMAPEHLNGDPHDHRVDIYAVGVILYEMLTGGTPFSPDAPGTFIQQVLFEPPEPPSRRAPDARIPPDLDYIVLRALEKRPEDRFRSMDELAAALSSVRREAAPPIALAPWPVSPLLAPAAPLPSDAPIPPAAVATRSRARIGLRTRVGLLGVLALGAVIVRASLAMTEPNDSTPAPAPESAPMVAPPSIEPSMTEELPTPPPAEPSPDLPLSPPSEPTVVEPVTASDTKITRAQARSTAPARARERDLPAMTISPFERQKLFAAHRDAVAARCKSRRSLENAIVVLQITIEAGRIVRAVLNSGPDRDPDREAAARCVQKYLRTQVQVPKSMSGRATFFYAF